MRKIAAVLAALLVGCSDIASDGSGVVSLQVVIPTPSTLEVGETLQMIARALGRDGEEIQVPISWRTADTTITIDSTSGLVTAVIPGVGRVQAVEGALVSQPVTLTVLPGVDSLAVATDTVTVAASATPSGALFAQVLQASDTAASGYIPVAGRAVIATIVFPVFPDPSARTVEITGAALADTVVAGTDGMPAPPITLSRVSGQTTPDTVRVEMRVERQSGTVVPGSGGIIVVVFE